MQKIVAAAIAAIVLVFFLSVLSDSGIASTILSHQPVSAKFQACKGVLKNTEIINKQREALGLEPIQEKK